MTSNDNSAEESAWIKLTQRLLDSYQHFVGKPLIPRETPEADSVKLIDAPFVVVAHGTEDDPLLNYGNRTALKLWELPLNQLIGMPSRKTAEPVHRDERARLLQRTRDYGFIDDYSGVRITASGRRFRIHSATVWNVINAAGDRVGQAAAFAEWTFLNAGD